jgi:hypothetical protein
MSEIYSSYLSGSTQKKENIYASWPKEKNTWGKNTASAPLVSAPLVSAPLVSAPLVSAPLVSAPLVSAPLVPALRIPPPPVNRHNKPEIFTFKDGIVEEAY